MKKERGGWQIWICKKNQEKINSNALFILIANEGEKTKKQKKIYEVKNYESLTKIEYEKKK